METNTAISERNNAKLYLSASYLIAFTIIYNLLEGFVSVYLGFEDESLTLFGFGVDSFIEVMSGIGVAHMLYRIKRQPNSNRDQFEKTALRVTGAAFYVLVIGLVSTGVYNLVSGHKPQATFWGIVISSISILIMWALIVGKTKVGKSLNSPAILADAQCARVCIYMSVILLCSSVVCEFTNIGYIDSLGSIGLAFFSFREGRECFKKANSADVCSCVHD